VVFYGVLPEPDGGLHDLGSLVDERAADFVLGAVLNVDAFDCFLAHAFLLRFTGLVEQTHLVLNWRRRRDGALSEQPFGGDGGGRQDV